jgi:SOS-response transcriptional repressor LexA
MKDYAQQIRKLRVQLGLTQYALALSIGVRPQVVASWEQGRREPAAESYFRLGRLAPPEEAWFFLGKMGVTRELVLEKWGDAEALTRRKPVFEPPEIRARTTDMEDRLGKHLQVPVLRDSAAANSPLQINENDIESFLAIPARFLPKGPEAYTGVYVRGDAMEPTLREGFIVIIDHTQRDPSELRGQLVAALVQDSVMVKRLAQESRADRLILRSDNPTYEDLVFEAPEGLVILGQVLFWWGSVASIPAGRPLLASADN